MEQVEVNFVDLGPHLRPSNLPNNCTYALFSLRGGSEASIHHTVKSVIPKVGTILSDKKVTVEEGLELIKFFEPGFVQQHRKVFDHVPTAVEALNGLNKAREDGMWTLSDLRYAIPLLDRLF